MKFPSFFPSTIFFTYLLQAFLYNRPVYVLSRRISCCTTCGLAILYSLRAHCYCCYKILSNLHDTNTVPITYLSILYFTLTVSYIYISSLWPDLPLCYIIFHITCRLPHYEQRDCCHRIFFYFARHQCNMVPIIYY